VIFSNETCSTLPRWVRQLYCQTTYTDWKSSANCSATFQGSNKCLQSTSSWTEVEFHSLK
jgi:hypothetical protein